MLHAKQSSEQPGINMLSRTTSNEEIVRVSAPAKINLHLEVLGLRDDGFHELAMDMQSINLTDPDRTFGPIRDPFLIMMTNANTKFIDNFRNYMETKLKPLSIQKMEYTSI